MLLKYSINSLLLGKDGKLRQQETSMLLMNYWIIAKIINSSSYVKGNIGMPKVSSAIL